MKMLVCKHGVAKSYRWILRWCVTVAGCSGRHMTAASLPARMRKCQDLPAITEEGGDAELLSLSLWSLSSQDEGTAELLSPLCVMSLLQVSI